MYDLELHSVDEIVRYFMGEINDLLFRPWDLAGALKESTEMMNLDLCWIRELVSSDYGTDARNEEAAKTARQLIEIPLIKEKANRLFRNFLLLLSRTKKL